MPNIYTRKGDKGSTGLFGGTRVLKQDSAVEAYGSVDEANSAIGYAKLLVDGDYRDILHQIQMRLFTLAAELASDDRGRAQLGGMISSGDVEDLERIIDGCLAETGVQDHFVVPGRDPASASLHQARTVVRRAERRVLTMAETHPVREEIIRYLNRLSDALYAIARVHECRADRAMVEQVVRRAVATATGRHPDELRISGAVDGDGSRDPAFDRGMELDLPSAKLLAEAAEAKGAEMGVPIVFAAVDAGGNLILVHRMADSLLASIDIAINKAYTSAALKTATADLAQSAGPTGPLYGIEESNGGRLILFGGGLPVFCHGVITGGIGVSGGSVDEDVTIVTYAFNQVMRS